MKKDSQCICEAREYLALALRVECTKDSTTNGSLVCTPGAPGAIFGVTNRSAQRPNGLCIKNNTVGTAHTYFDFGHGAIQTRKDRLQWFGNIWINCLTKRIFCDTHFAASLTMRLTDREVDWNGPSHLWTFHILEHWLSLDWPICEIAHVLGTERMPCQIELLDRVVSCHQELGDMSNTQRGWICQM